MSATKPHPAIRVGIILGTSAGLWWLIMSVAQMCSEALSGLVFLG